jgi:hypothetical protein
MTDEIQAIISGKKQVSHGFAIQTVLHYLRGSQETSPLAQTDKHFKKQETARLIVFY